MIVPGKELRQMISIVLHLYLKVIFEKKNTFRPIYFEICYVYNKSYAIPYSIKLQAHACSESNPLPFHWRSFRYRDMEQSFVKYGTRLHANLNLLIVFSVFFFFYLKYVGAFFFTFPFDRSCTLDFNQIHVQTAFQNMYIQCINKTCINMYSSTATQWNNIKRVSLVNVIHVHVLVQLSILFSYKYKCVNIMH